MNKEFREILLGFKRALNLIDRPEKTLLFIALLLMLINGVLTNLLAVISGLTYLSAYQIGRNAAQIASLNQTSTVMSVILAILVLKERGGFIRKLVAAGLGVTGVILVL